MCHIQLTYQNIYCIAMDNYMKFEMIGRGSNGTKVYLVKNLIDNNLYAMKKIFHKEENDSNDYGPECYDNRTGRMWKQGGRW